jgi:hypothetical protein
MATIVCRVQWAAENPLGSVRMDLEQFIQRRPVLFHTTSRFNLTRLREIGALESTRTLFERAGRAGDPALRERRRCTRTVIVDGHSVTVRDQQPLAAGTIEFEAGWDLARFVEYLNGFVFFWPGTADGPIPYGCRHFERYRDAGEDLAVVRVPTRALLMANRERPPLFSRCNSGSPRMNAGRRAPRGGDTFRPSPCFVGSPAAVKEVVFEGRALLSAEAKWAPSLSGAWVSLGPRG